ncbi:MAG: CocE/NonD family hydrolase [Pyrinomonadaceae bacterium]|nr:CocE/NonD family hydrolase [Pyrinomonadaceae bacterium]
MYRHRFLPLRSSALLVSLLLIFSSTLYAQNTTNNEFDIAANYAKREEMIPMRDGVRLFTAIYTPKDSTQKYPVMLTRTPYSAAPYGAEKYRLSLGPSPAFAREGYIFVYQDVRGRFMSEGEFVHVRPHIARKTSPKEIDENTDTYDTIEWMLKNIPNHNGRVGMWGISYPGFYTSTGIIDSHRAIRAASPQAPVADWFIGDDWHHNGTLFLPHAFTWLARNGRPRAKPTTQAATIFDYPTPDGYRFFLDIGPLTNANAQYFKGEIPFWNDLMEHGTYDEFWRARNILPHLRNVKPAVMTVGGWFDSENLYGALKTYESIEAKNRGIYNVLVMGPWEHGHWASTDGDQLGDLHFGAKTAHFYREQIELPFFNYHLKDKGTLKLPEAYVFETGTNQWRTYDAYPPPTAVQRSLYFHANGKLSFDAPTSGTAFDEYVSDPAKPVPHLSTISTGMKSGYMAEDQRFADRRPDVLVYQTDVLTEDVTIAGPITASLHVSTTGTDADFIIKLIDVFPPDMPDPEPNPTGVRMGGFQMLVRGEPMRAKFRNSFERPEPMKPGEVTKVEWTMPDACHTFKRGHRIMVHVQSTWFPLVDRNPQKFVDIYKATETDFQKATQRLYRSSEFNSLLKLNVTSR